MVPSATDSRIIGESTPSGPSSRNTAAPAPDSVRIPSANRTVSRTWRTQYSGEQSSPAVASAPVRFDTTGIVGSWKVRSPTTVRNSASIGSINGEWNAWLTASSLLRRPSNRATTSATADSSPDSTTDDGPFTAATDTRSDSNDRTSSSAASTATITPPTGNACINPARADTSRHASSNDSTPATCAAATSPIECPATNLGTTPNDSSSRNKATSTANSAG